MRTLAMMLGGSGITAEITLSTNRAQWSIAVDAPTLSGRQVTLTLRIASNIEIQSTSVAAPAIDLTGLGSGSAVTIYNQGYLLGMGGAGGAGGDTMEGDPGENGGHAIYAPYSGSLTIDNATGYIWGGGGGGGGGGDKDFGVWTTGGGGGGAGGGAPGGSPDTLPGTNGTSGRYGGAGTGGIANSSGGNGGVYGSAGTSGASTGDYSGGSGGAAGYAVKLGSGTGITWLFGSSRVAGSVGT